MAALYQPEHTDEAGGTAARSKLQYWVILKDGLNFIRLYFLNYAWFVNDLHKI